jgi:hypothetical protein
VLADCRVGRLSVGGLSFGGLSFGELSYLLDCRVGGLSEYDFYERVWLTEKMGFHNFFVPFMNYYGKWSELRISERRKPKRTPKTMQAITTSKRFIKAIRTSKSERRKCLLS